MNIAVLILGALAVILALASLYIQDGRRKLAALLLVLVTESAGLALAVDAHKVWAVAAFAVTVAIFATAAVMQGVRVLNRRGTVA